MQACRERTIIRSLPRVFIRYVIVWVQAQTISSAWLLPSRTFGDDDLAVNTFFELGYVRDDADQTVSLRQTRERLIRLAERRRVERAEALVHKERVEMIPGGHLHHSSERPSASASRGKKRLAAGERIDARSVALM